MTPYFHIGITRVSIRGYIITSKIYGHKLQKGTNSVDKCVDKNGHLDKTHIFNSMMTSLIITIK